MSPEIALAQEYDMTSDIFSYGIVLCEMITNIPPSKTFMNRVPRNSFALEEEEVARHVLKDCPEGLEGRYTPCLLWQCHSTIIVFSQIGAASLIN